MKIFLTLLVLFAQNCFSQNGYIIDTREVPNSKIKLNSKPYLKFTDWIANVPKDKNLEGKFIVLEFWASWCNPCLEQVNHLNELQSKFNNENLYFISMTDEETEIVRNVLKKNEFKSIVVSDKRTLNSFWNGGLKKLVLPFTILIDDEGYIKWIGMPTLLKEEDIRELITKKIKPYSMYERPKR